MSIINEALKKTEQYVHINTAGKIQPHKTKLSPKLFLIYALILLSGLFLSHIIFKLLGQKVVKTQPQKEIIAVVQNQQTTLPALLPVKPASLTEEQKKPEVNYILNGIFFSDNDGYALVNNQIIRESDSVDGAKVIKITPNSVELDSQGTLITLNTQR